ncbi:MAG: LuxR C-terminal-related transcriptional regulator [Roseiarcus sp.]|jgi:two-component system CheB/CheR fusion protein
MEAKSQSTVWSDAGVGHGRWLPHEARPRRAAYPAWLPAAMALQTRTIFIVDPDRAIREALRGLFEDDGYQVRLFADRRAFLRAYRPVRRGCLVIDESSMAAGGLEWIESCAGRRLRYIVMSAHFTLPIAVQAMRAGAFDLVEKPLYRADILASMTRAFDQPNDVAEDSALRDAAALRMAGLTARQREILDLVVAGHPSKNIAADLGISLRTVENHRAKIAKRTGSKSLPALIRTAACAGCTLSMRTVPDGASASQ